MLSISEFKKMYGVSITDKHNDKMSGLWSLSTSPLCNGNCLARVSNARMICSHCFSMVMNKRFKNLSVMLKNNFEVLTNEIIPVCDLPKIGSLYFRFESFGDIATEIQVVNYFNIALANPLVKCALWTKNPWIIERAIANYGLVKPENLVIIGSSYFVNEPMDAFYNKYSFIDKVFTVYDKTYIANANIEINCGARSCLQCGRCYENLGGRAVNEKLK